MDAIIVKNKVLLLEQVCPTNLPGQPGVYTRKQSGVFPFSSGPPFPRGPEGSMEEELHASLLNPSFVPQPCQQTAIFIPAVTRITSERCC